MKQDPTAAPPIASPRLHGEYKTPGGKLVVVDFSLQEGALTGVQIAGDFFLFPDDALARLCKGLEGTLHSHSIHERMAAIDASMAVGDEMIGFTSHAIAVAVERAISLTQ